jgi:hypothetical protein
MKTNWRELLGSIPPAEAFDPLNLKNLGFSKREDSESTIPDTLVNKVNKVKSPPEPLSQISNSKANKVKRAKSQLADLENRLRDRGISIAIDRKTGGAILLLKPSDADIVKDVADVYQSFQIGKLTEAQQREIEHDLNYYEELERRKET